MRSSQNEAPRFYRDYQPLRGKQPVLLTPNKRPISATQQTRSTRATVSSVPRSETPIRTIQSSPFNHSEQKEIPRNLVHFSVSSPNNHQSYFKRVQNQVQEISGLQTNSKLKESTTCQNRDKTPVTQDKFHFESRVAGSVRLSDKKKYIGAYFLKEKQAMFQVETPPTVLKPLLLGSRPTSARVSEFNKENHFLQALQQTEIEKEAYPAGTHATLSSKDIAQEKICNIVNDSRIQKSKLSPNKVSKNIENIQVLLSFEKLFFAFTQAVMHQEKVSGVDFQKTENLLTESCDFVQKSMKFSASIAASFTLNCRLSLLSLQLAKTGFTHITRKSLLINHFRCLVINLHQNVLYLLETLTSGNQIDKLNQIKCNLQTALTSCKSMFTHSDQFKSYSQVLKKLELQTDLRSIKDFIIELHSISKPSQKSLSVTRQSQDPLLEPENTIQQRQHSPHVQNPQKSSISDIQLGKKYTLVMDLDETLIHYDAQKRHINIRPFAKTFLEQLSQYYEVIVFTAAQKSYADVILDKLDPKNEFIAHRLYRESCVFRGGVHIKDLAILGRDLTKTIIVDNIRENFQRQPSNGIHIESFYSSAKDRELEALAPFLKGLVANHIKDVRGLVKMYNPAFWRSKLPMKKQAESACKMR